MQFINVNQLQLSINVKVETCSALKKKKFTELGQSLPLMNSQIQKLVSHTLMKNRNNKLSNKIKNRLLKAAQSAYNQPEG